MSNICSQFFRVPNKRAILSQICSPLCTPNASVRKKRATWMEDGGGKEVSCLFFPWEIKLLVRYYFFAGLANFKALLERWLFSMPKIFLARSQYRYIETRKLGTLGDDLRAAECLSYTKEHVWLECSIHHSCLTWKTLQMSALCWCATWSTDIAIQVLPCSSSKVTKSLRQ